LRQRHSSRRGSAEGEELVPSAAPATRVWLFGAAAFWALALFLLTASWFGAHEPAIWVLLALVPVLVLVGAVFLFAVRQRRAISIRIVGDTVALNLPRGRDMTRPRALRERVALAQVQAVLTRAEFFGRAMALPQQAYALALNDGRHLRLGADQVQNEPIYGGVAAALAQRIGAELVDEGGVDVATRWMGLKIGPVPAWSSESLPSSRVEQRWRSGRITWAVVGAALAFASLARMCSGAT
jgi:hypothetical protein